MRRVIQVHNYYGSASPSGENIAVDRERELLVDSGAEVTLFARYSDTLRQAGIWGSVLGGLSTPWNSAAAAKLAKLARETQPDVVHVHNTFPLISPAIFRALRSVSPRVLTLHNYRLFCAAAIPMRDGVVCTECLDRKSVQPAINHGCYRDSRIATVPLALNVALHRKIGTWLNEVDAFIVFSEFQRQKMILAGLPPGLIHIKPNFYPGNPSVQPWPDRQTDVVFVGRLSREKGVHTLIKAWCAWGTEAPKLTLIGDGPERASLESVASGLPVEFFGHVSSECAIAAIASAKLVVMPSEWYEGFPLVVGEAFAHGTPILGSGIGPLTELIDNNDAGVTFAVGNASELHAKLVFLWNNPRLLAEKGKNARRAFDKFYAASSNLRQLREIYDSAKVIFEKRQQSREFGV